MSALGIKPHIQARAKCLPIGTAPRHSAYVILVLASVGTLPALAQTDNTPANPDAAATQTPAATTAPPRDARAQAPFDPSGYWVSLVTRDWRYRMIVPAAGEYQGIPLSLAGKQFADHWNATADQAAGKQCEAYGAPAMPLIPLRLRISWQDGNTLVLRTDAGMQTRVLHFNPGSAKGTPSSWQGYSHASWELHEVNPMVPVRVPPAPGPSYGSIKVLTDHLLQGLIRKNGVAYSAQATLTEYLEQDQDPATGTTYLIDTAVLHDPVYMNNDYHYAATFQKEADGSKWDPTPCSLNSAP